MTKEWRFAHNIRECGYQQRIIIIYSGIAPASQTLKEVLMLVLASIITVVRLDDNIAQRLSQCLTAN